MKKSVRLAVFASGGGTNLQALIDHFENSPAAVARVELVVGNRAGIGAFARAEAAGVPWMVVDTGAPDAAGAMLAVLDRHAIDLIVLAGYLKLIPPDVVGRYEGRMINIHPALLPAFGGPGMYGARVHRAVIESGARVTGATVHLVGHRYDEGPILAQWPVPVLPGDTPERLAARVLRVEHLLLPAAVEALVARGQARGAEARGGSDEVDGDADGFSRVFEIVDGAEPDQESVRRLNF